MAFPRAIDRALAPTNPKEMKVLVLGMSRTGTASLKNALSKLGFSMYHMSEAYRRMDEGHLKYWLEALQAKYEGHGRPYGPEQIRKLLAKYDAVSDIPSILFVEELLEAYPDAKVVLNTRDTDRWLASMDRTLCKIVKWPRLRVLAFFDRPVFHPYMQIFDLVFSVWTKGQPDSRTALQRGFQDHYQRVRKLVPRDRLLEYRVEEGWGPLCAFLDVPIPKRSGPKLKGDIWEFPAGNAKVPELIEKEGIGTDLEPFPNVNDADALLKIQAFLFWARSAVVLAKGIGLAGAVAATAVVIKWVL